MCANYYSKTFRVLNIVVTNYTHNGILVLIYNGIRQGDILSTRLFSAHMDSLSNMLIDSGVGCYIDNVGGNHVFYANKPHVCTMVLCAIALEVTLNIYL